MLCSPAFAGEFFHLYTYLYAKLKLPLDIFRKMSIIVISTYVLSDKNNLPKACKSTAFKYLAPPHKFAMPKAGTGICVFVRILIMKGMID